MAMRIKLNGVCCLSLSKGCFLLGLLDLAIKAYLITILINGAVEKHTTNYNLLLIVGAIGFCTCLFMLSGSILETQWAMLPYLGSEMILIIVYIIVGLCLLAQHLKGDHTIEVLMIVVILGCLPILYIYIWNVVYNRYQEIKEKRSASSEIGVTE